MDWQRKQFEHYVEENCLGMTSKDSRGDYFNPLVEMLFHVWQSAQEAAKPKWISVDDELPSNDFDSNEYIVFEALNSKVQHDYYMVPDDGCEPFWNHYGKHVTHWMEMPKPVKPFD